LCRTRCPGFVSIPGIRREAVYDELKQATKAQEDVSDLGLEALSLLKAVNEV
jgi:hypothetical protein